MDFSVDVDSEVAAVEVLVVSSTSGGLGGATVSSGILVIGSDVASTGLSAQKLVVVPELSASSGHFFVPGLAASSEKILIRIEYRRTCFENSPTCFEFKEFTNKVKKYCSHQYE